LLIRIAVPDNPSNACLDPILVNADDVIIVIYSDAQQRFARAGRRVL